MPHGEGASAAPAIRQQAQNVSFPNRNFLYRAMQTFPNAGQRIV